MAQLFDRLNRELETFGKRAQAALDEGRLHMELLRHRRQQAGAARDLGLLIYRRERGGEVDPRRVDAVLLRLDDLAVQITRLENEITARRGARSETTPPSNPATPEVVRGA